MKDEVDAVADARRLTAGIKRGGPTLVVKCLGHRGYTLALLAVVRAFSLVDLLALGLALQSIKADLHLSDPELGVLTGIAFAFFYATMGIPIGRWADRGNRVTIILLTAALWSLMVMLTGTARSFWQLLAIRAGVAIGEAGCTPPAYSLIGDLYTREERPRALAIYMLGGAASTLIGYFFGGWLNEFYGWRVMFVLLGLPGLALAVLAGVTLQEPRKARGEHQAESSSAKNDSGAQASVPEALRTLFGTKTFRWLLFAFAVNWFFGSGLGQWQPAFFVRSYGLRTGNLGTWFALIYGVPGIIGNYWGGHMISRYAPRDERLQIWILAVLNTVSALVMALIYISRTYLVGFCFLATVTFCSALTLGPMFSLLQAVVPNRMHAMSLSIIYLFANLIGSGLGPLAVGLVSGALQPLVGVQSLRYALLLMCPGLLFGSVFFLQAARSVRLDIDRIIGAGGRSGAVSTGSR